MTREQFSHAAGRPSVKTFQNARRRSRAGGSCAKWATATFASALVAATLQLVAGCAEEVESAPKQTTVEPEPGIHAVRMKPPSEEPPLGGPEFRLQKKRNWWNHAREVLFDDIELSAEQAHAVDAIIEAQLNTRALLQQRDAELNAARKSRDPKRIAAAREEVRVIKDQLKKPHEIYEEMRAVLTEEQRPAFDMGRARHVAETQGAGRTHSGGRAERAERERVQRRIE